MAARPNGSTRSSATYGAAIALNCSVTRRERTANISRRVTATSPPIRSSSTSALHRPDVNSQDAREKVAIGSPLALSSVPRRDRLLVVRLVRALETTSPRLVSNMEPAVPQAERRGIDVNADYRLVILRALGTASAYSRRSAMACVMLRRAESNLSSVCSDSLTPTPPGDHSPSLVPEPKPRADLVASAKSPMQRTQIEDTTVVFAFGPPGAPIWRIAGMWRTELKLS
jgi:hypothetical protein